MEKIFGDLVPVTLPATPVISSHQREIRILAAHRSPEFIVEPLIERCRNEHDAFLLCWNKRQVKYTQATAADILGIQRSHFSNILAGKKHPPWGFTTNLQALCGNWAIRQYRDKVEGFRTVVETAVERELRVLR